MHVNVNRAGQYMQYRGVNGLARRRHGVAGTNGDDEAVVDGNGAVRNAIRRHQPAAGNHEVDGLLLLIHGTKAAISCATRNRSSLRLRKESAMSRTSRSMAS